MIIPESRTFDQRTLTLLLEHDPLVQRYRAFFALFDWSLVPQASIDPSRPGKRPHPKSAYVKALLLKIEQGLPSCTQLRRFLLEHPLLVLELGLRPVLNRDLPYGFDVAKTVPTARWLRKLQHALSQPVLQDLLAATVRDLREEIPGLGEVVAFDVTHSYAFVKENNPRVYVKERFREGAATQRRSGLQTGRQEEYQPRASRWLQKSRERIPLGLWLWGGQRVRGWLWRGGAGRNHATQRARAISPTSSRSPSARSRL